MATLHSIADIHKRAKIEAIIAADSTTLTVTRNPTSITAVNAAGGREISAVKSIGRADRWAIMVSERIAKEQRLPLWRDG